ncbi:hypothetical protein [Parafrankia sp. BMG5.11]|uniref:hypothetical protein n=1 Tax=Parafrankia sp. BMG5.11 TaxID=222540 RepID=UPI001039C7E5|nr:hypothetical protein [Parafrankia sp. BMG5.11]TCJ38211.1 hypothetical protein E0504_14645 [Parafrankia sp. BMG5.11]
MARQFSETRTETAPTAAPLGGTRAQSLQRLQVGASLLVGIVLIVGLANVIEERAKQSDRSAVPEAASTVAPTTAVIPANDPLADAGVVPDLPDATVSPTASAAPQPAPSDPQ